MEMKSLLLGSMAAMTVLESANQSMYAGNTGDPRKEYKLNIRASRRDIEDTMRALSYIREGPSQPPNHYYDDNRVADPDKKKKRKAQSKARAKNRR